ncbi:hypothetical protein SMICM304S_02349 [Streptomyces microflavus]
MACIAFDLPVSKSTTTHHFKVLREAGVIRQHYEGTSRMSRLREDDLEARFPGSWRPSWRGRGARPAPRACGLNRVRRPPRARERARGGRRTAADRPAQIVAVSITKR